MNFLIGIVAGALFSAGLVIARMTDPSRVLGFLDVGHWDPRLGFVMLGAIAVHAPVVWWIRRRGKPMMAQRIHIPERTRVDSPLVIGASLFGVGWGLGGYCPGPALTAAARSLPTLLLTLAMLAGMLIHDWIMKVTTTRARVQDTRDECASRLGDYPRGQGQGVSG